MPIMKRGFKRAFAPASVALLALGMMPSGFGQTKNAPDNSDNNKAHNRTQTADQQTNNTSDRELTAKIRRAVVAEKSLSTYGHNVKIIVTGGAVTLKGPVHSEDEKRTIAAKAAEVVGEGKVTNQLTVKQ